MVADQPEQGHAFEQLDGEVRKQLPRHPGAHEQHRRVLEDADPLDPPGVGGLERGLHVVRCGGGLDAQHVTISGKKSVADVLEDRGRSPWR